MKIVPRILIVILPGFIVFTADADISTRQKTVSAFPIKPGSASSTTNAGSTQSILGTSPCSATGQSVKPSIQTFPAFGEIGKMVTVRARLSLQGKPIVNKDILFTSHLVYPGQAGNSPTDYGRGKTNAEGVAQVSFKLMPAMSGMGMAPGNQQTITAFFPGHGACQGTSELLKISTYPCPTKIMVNAPTMVQAGSVLEVRAKTVCVNDQSVLTGLSYKLDNQNDWIPIPNRHSDGFHDIRSFVPKDKTGTMQVRVRRASNDNYMASNAAATVKVIALPPPLRK